VNTGYEAPSAVLALEAQVAFIVLLERGDHEDLERAFWKLQWLAERTPVSGRHRRRPSELDPAAGCCSRSVSSAETVRSLGQYHRDLVVPHVHVPIQVCGLDRLFHRLPASHVGWDVGTSTKAPMGGSTIRSAIAYGHSRAATSFEAHQEVVRTFGQPDLELNAVRDLVMKNALAGGRVWPLSQTSAGPFVVRMHVTSTAVGLSTRLYAHARR